MPDNSPYYVPPNCRVVIDGELAYRISEILEESILKMELRAVVDEASAKFHHDKGEDLEFAHAFAYADVASKLSKQAINYRTKATNARVLLDQFDDAMRKASKEHKT